MDIARPCAAVRRAESFYNAHENYNLFGNNCHQYSAHAMNLMGYGGRRDWNMVHLAALMLFTGHWVDAWSVRGPLHWHPPPFSYNIFIRAEGDDVFLREWLLVQRWGEGGHDGGLG